MDLAQALDWYAHLAVQPGWKPYVWHRVKELASQHPAMFRDLPELLTKRMLSNENDLPDRGNRA